MHVTNQLRRSPQQLRLPMNYRIGRRKAGVKIKISKLRRDFPDQLAPFNELWGFYCDLDRYNGTIFRFALRKEGSQSELLETIINSFSTAKSTFQDAFETARLSLLFLKRIRKIDFRIRRKSLEWEVRMEKAENITFSDCLLIRLTKASPIASVLSWTDKWWRVIEDLRDAPDGLQYRHKRTMKHKECGIAALISSEPSEAGSLRPKEVSPRFFNCLPLRFPSRLPVHVHATFLLSGDRQSISIEATARDSGSDWNKWILESAIPQLYLSFLEDVGRKIGTKVFSFFPTQTSTGNNLSDLVGSSFWSLVPTSHHRLYPVVEGHGQRRAPQLVEFQEATFNLDTSLSKDLIAVLPFLFKNLVQPTNSLRSCMNRLPKIRVVNASLVRRALQSKEAAGHLMDSLKRESHLLKSLLHYVTPISDADLDELKNCRILPVVNGPLGRLVSRSQSSQSTYFLVDVAERKLFSFAAGVLISDEIDTEFMNKIKRALIVLMLTL
jgi:sacsin